MSDARTVASLVAAVPGAALVRGDGAAVLGGIEHDSRRVAAGTAFVAVPGFSADGHGFLDAAIAAGAGAVVVIVTRGRKGPKGRLPLAG